MEQRQPRDGSCPQILTTAVLRVGKFLRSHAERIRRSIRNTAADLRHLQGR
jgi:hypothetical protein